jgi:hypothetical protein
VLYKDVAFFILIVLAAVAVASLTSSEFRKKRFNMKWSMWVTAVIILIELIVCCILAIVSAHSPCSCFSSCAYFALLSPIFAILSFISTCSRSSATARGSPQQLLCYSAPPSILYYSILFFFTLFILILLFFISSALFAELILLRIPTLVSSI